MKIVSAMEGDLCGIRYIESSAESAESDEILNELSQLFSTTFHVIYLFVFGKSSTHMHCSVIHE